MIMQEELRKQEILAKERQTQIEELKQQIHDSEQRSSAQDPNQKGKTQTSLIEKMRQQIEKERGRNTAEITEQSEKHLERERHLSE